YEDGQGMLRVEGSAATDFYVFSESGEQIGHQVLNRTLALNPGPYKVKVNNSVHAVEIRSHKLLSCATGSLLVSGNTGEYYYVTDTTGQQLTYQTLGQSTCYFPGRYAIRVNNTDVVAEVKLREMTEIRTGTLLVRGMTPDYYYVLDTGNKQLNYNTLEKPLAFLPGVYDVKVNNTSMKAEVLAGK